MKINVITTLLLLARLAMCFFTSHGKTISGGPDAGIDYVYTHSWATKTSLPSARSDFTATTVQDKIVLTGGLSHLFKNTIKGKSAIKKDLTITGLKKVILKLIK